MKYLLNRWVIAAIIVTTGIVPQKTFGQSKDDGTSEDTLALTIEKSLEIALSDNPVIKIADKEIERVDYSRKEAWSAIIPSISAEGSYSRNIKKPVMFLPEDSPFSAGGGSNTIEIGYDNSYSGAIRVSMPLFNMSLFRSIQMTEVEMEQALESARQSRINLISEVKKSYYNNMLINDSYEVLKRSVQNARENYENTKRMYDQGMVAEYDVIRAEVQMRNLMPNLVEAENGLKNAGFMLKVLLGLDDEIPIKIEGDLESFSNEIEINPLQDNINLSRNSQLRQLELQELQMEKQFEMTRAGRFPTISSFFNYQFQTEANDFEFGDYQWVEPAVIGLQLQIPIFSGFSKRYQEKQVEVGMEQLVFERENLDRNLTVSALNSRTNMATAVEKVESGRIAVQQARRGYEIAKTRYNAGAGTLLELNDAEVALTQARLNLNQARFDFLSARAEYEKILGNNVPETPDNQ